MADPKNQLRKHSINPATSPFAFVWEERGRRVAVLRRTAQANTGFRPGAAIVQATPACLIADGEQTPQVFCASGWRPQESTQTSTNMLDGARWTDLVRRFAAVCPQGFRLPRSFRDTPRSAVHVPENGGRYYACHTEKKLALYFLVQQMKFSGVGLRETLAGRLRTVSLPPNRRGATIVLGHKPCKNCRLFLRFIRLRTGITLRTRPSPIYVEHEGRPVAFRGGKPTEKGTEAVSAEVDASVIRDDDVDDDGDELAGAEDHNDEAAADGDEAVNEDNDDDDDDEIDQDAVDSPDALDVAEALLANAPPGNVTRPRAGDPSRRTTPATAAPSPPRTPVHNGNATQQLSPVIRDTPEPSVSPSLSMTPDRRNRFPPYETPTRRRRRRHGDGDGDDDDDGSSSVAPPAVWQGRSKPPVTPSMQPPPWLLAEGSDRSNDRDDGDDGDGGDGGAATAADVSYHFATPSDPSREGTSNGDGDGDSNGECSLVSRNAVQDKPQPRPASPSVRAAAARPPPPRTVTFQVPEIATRPGHGDGVDRNPSQAWRRVRRNLFPPIARPPRPHTAAAADDTVAATATRMLAPPFPTAFAMRASWAAAADTDTETADAHASAPVGFAAMPLYARHTQHLVQQDEQQRVQQQQRRPAASELIDLTAEADETPVAPRTAGRPRTAMQRRRAALARERAKGRGDASGPLASSSGRRFPSLDGYRYNDLPFGHV